MSVHRIAVCDDVALERDVLCMLLREFGEMPLLCQFASGEELLRARGHFDLVFLDIYMNGMTGMETARRLQEKDPSVQIVFLTATPDFAVESYEVQAFDYIVKPLQPERLKTVLSRFLARDRRRAAPRFLVINDAAGVCRLPYEQIEFLESSCHYVTIHTLDGAAPRVYGRLDDFERQLHDARFLRCHKSFLINLELTRSMEEDFLLYSGTRVPYRKRDKKSLQNAYCAYMRGLEEPGVRRCG